MSQSVPLALCGSGLVQQNKGRLSSRFDPGERQDFIVIRSVVSWRGHMYSNVFQKNLQMGGKKVIYTVFLPS